MGGRRPNTYATPKKEETNAHTHKLTSDNFLGRASLRNLPIAAIF